MPKREGFAGLGPCARAGESFRCSLLPSAACTSGVGPRWNFREAEGGEIAESMRGNSFREDDLDEKPKRDLKLDELGDTGVS